MFYFVAASFVVLFWPPYDLAVAAVVAVIAWWIGDVPYRWWPIARYRERHHELNVPRGDAKPERK